MRAPSILNGIMLSTIQFNDQLLFIKSKVEKKASHKVLPTKFISIQLAITQTLPQTLLNVSTTDT